MKEHTRNVVVGLTALVALAMFGAMIMIFTGLPELLETGHVLRLKFPETAGAKSGEWIYMSGIQIGKITSVEFAEPDPRKGVMFICRINSGVKIPGNVEPTITARAFVGGPYLELRPSGEDRYDPATKKKLEYLPDNWPDPLQGRHIFPSMLPKELTDGFKSLSKLANSLNSLLAAPAETQPGGTQPTTGPAPATLGQTLAKFAQALDDLHEVLGDKANQENLKKSLAGLADATAKASEAMDALKAFAVEGREKAGKTLTAASQAAEKLGKLAENTDRRMDDVSKKIIADAEQLSKVLKTINRIATKIDTGEGTIGKFVNDPKLYNNFLQASKQLSDLAAELRVLIGEWEKNGVQLKVK